MKYLPLIVSLACLVGGIVCLSIGHNEAGMTLIGAFVGQFVPGAHTSLVPKEEEDLP